MSRIPLSTLSAEQCWQLLRTFGFPDERRYWKQQQYPTLDGDLLQYANVESDLSSSYFANVNVPSLVYKRFLHYLEDDFLPNGVPAELCNPAAIPTSSHNSSSDSGTSSVKEVIVEQEVPKLHHRQQAAEGERESNNATKRKSSIDAHAEKTVKTPRTEMVPHKVQREDFSAQSSTKLLLDKLVQSQQVNTKVELLQLLRRRLNADTRHPQTRLSAILSLTSSKQYLQFPQLCGAHQDNEMLVSLAVGVFVDWLQAAEGTLTAPMLVEIMTSSLCLPLQCPHAMKMLNSILVVLNKSTQQESSVRQFREHRRNEVKAFEDKFRHVQGEMQDLLLSFLGALKEPTEMDQNESLLRV